MADNFLRKFSLNVTNDNLVISVQVELYDDIIEELQHQILHQVYNKGLQGVLIDLSGVDIIDSFVLRLLMDTAKMAKLLGARTLFTGIKPEIVATLVDFGEVPSEIMVVLNVDEGLRVLNARGTP